MRPAVRPRSLLNPPPSPVEYLHAKRLRDIDEQLAILDAKIARRAPYAFMAREREFLMAQRLYWAGITLRSVWWDAIGREEAGERQKAEQAQVQRVQDMLNNSPAMTDEDVARAQRRLGGSP